MTTTPDLDPVLDLLMRVREALKDPANWAHSPEDDGYCLGNTIGMVSGVLGEGSIEAAANGTFEQMLTLDNQATGYVLRVIGGKTLEDIWHYNDAPERTHRDILDVMDSAVSLRVEELAGEGMPAFLRVQGE